MKSTSLPSDISAPKDVTDCVLKKLRRIGGVLGTWRRDDLPTTVSLIGLHREESLKVPLSVVAAQIADGLPKAMKGILEPKHLYAA